MNPGELAIELFCRGVRLDGWADSGEPGRPILRTRAGLGSGLELVLAGAPPVHRDVWINAPVVEHFVAGSPFHLRRSADFGVEIVDDRDGSCHPVKLPPEPAWYRRETRRGVEMRRVGVLQGTYLGIYVSRTCLFWTRDEPCRCAFSTTGENVGAQEESQKLVEDVLDVARAAKQESGVTFVHLNTGYQGGGALQRMVPYVEALKRAVGTLVGVQAVPEGPLEDYDRLIEAGCDHFSFCVEFEDADAFAEYCPGKAAEVGHARFYEALEYCQSRLPRGACSGEIIAGLEPVESTLAAIDRITALGAFPTVCIFRPLQGSLLESAPSPDPAEMRRIMRHMWERCRDHAIPIGLAPNIQVSLVFQPTDAAYLADRGWRDRWYLFTLGLKRRLAAPVFRRRMRARA